MPIPRPANAGAVATRRSGYVLSMQEQTAVVDGVPLRWFESGAGHVVVLVHGIPTSPALWRDVVPLLRDHRALAWEMVGYGASWNQALGRDISLAAQAHYLIQWIEHLGLGNCVLVGHDLGGGVAQIAATSRRDLFAGIVLTNSVCYDSWPIPSVKLMRRMGVLLANMPPKLFRAVFSSFLRRGHDDHRVATESIRHHWRHYDHEAGPRAFVEQIRSLRTADTLEIAPRLPTLDLPAAVVWGADDRFQKIGYGERLAAALKAEMTVVRGGKHFVPEDHPDAIADAITSVTEKGAR